MKQKTILITSGTSGIGKSIVTTILNDKETAVDKIYVNYGHNDENAKKMRDAFPEAQRSKIELIKFDMSNEDGLNDLTKFVNEHIKSLDWLILNTGIGTYKPFDEYDLELWNQIINTNLSIPAILVKKLKNKMAQGGKILFTGSYAGIEPYSSSIVYGVSKAGIHFYAKSLLKVFESKNVCVNAVAPAFVETDWQKDRSDESRDRINKKIASHRFGKPEEVAALSLSILKNDYINGSVYDITGGYNYF